eukprot:s782_g2.t1
MPQYTYLQVKTLFLELFCVSRTGVADPNIAHRKRSSFYIIEEGETEDGEQGFWVLDEETGEEGFTGLYTVTEFWVLGAKGSCSRRRLHGRTFKKGRPKGCGKKGGKRSRPGFRPRPKGKGHVATWDNDQQDTAFWQKGKGKKGKKGFMKGKDSFKGMPWKGGCKRYKKPDATIPAKKVEKKPLKKGVKKPIPADTPLEAPSKPSIFSDTEEFPSDPPMVASGPSSGHKDPEPSAPELQPEVKPEVKTEPKVEVKVEDKKEPMPKGTLSLALQRIHEKLQSPTELLKLHLKHYHMSTEQFKRRTSALKLPKEIYDKNAAITNSCDT